MRFTRTTAIFLIVAILLIISSIFILQTTSTTTETPVNTVTNNALFSDWRTNDIQRIIIEDTRNNADNTFVRDINGVWQIVGMVLSTDVLVAQNRVDEALATLLNLSITAQFKLDTTDDSLTPYGLDTPQFALTLTTVNEEIRTWYVGTTNPAGNRYYARSDDDMLTVYLISNVQQVDLVTPLAQNAPLLLPPTPIPTPEISIPGVIFPDYDARMIRELLWFDNADNNEVIVTRESGEFAQWDVADVNTINSEQLDLLVQAIGGLRATDVIRNVDISTLQLEPSRYVLEARSSQGRIFRLRVGQLDPTETRYYVLIDDLTAVFVVPRDDLDTLLDVITTPE